MSLFNQFYKVARPLFKSDKQLAETLGISRSSLAKYTRKNKPQSPTLSTLEKWCESLNIEIIDSCFKLKQTPSILPKIK